MTIVKVQSPVLPCLPLHPAPGQWQGRYARLTGWVEDNIEQTLTFFYLPRQHHKHMKSTNTLERLNQKIKPRTNVVRIFPMPKAACVWRGALAAETHGNWMEAMRYLNRDHLAEHKKE